MKVLFYPNRPAGGQRMFHYLKHLGLEWTNDPEPFDYTHVHHYNYANRVDGCPISWSGGRVLNKDLINIKKDYLDDIHKAVFGYRLRIDPVSHYGMCVLRSSQNAIHRGRLIQCPIKPYEVDTSVSMSKSGEPFKRIYVKFIDTRYSDELIRDFRFVIIGGKAVFLYEKFINSKCLFHAGPDDMHVNGYTEYSKFFSEDEMGKVHEFCNRIGCDFGEIDVLRDNSTGQMYICDVNPVPAGGAMKSCRWDGDVVDYLSTKYKESLLCL